MNPDEDKEAFKPALDSTKIAESRVCPTCGISVAFGITICPNDKTVLTDSPNLGEKLSHQYEIIEEIGSGGMGLIYKARHMALDQLVAIKMLHNNRLDRVGIERFAQEAKAVNLLDHPGIVHIRDYGVTELGQPYMVLDYIDARGLEEGIAFQGAFTLKDSLKIFVQIAEAMGHAHDHGILHRDLKPSNIMLIEKEGESPLVKIVDFGIAKIVDQSQLAEANLTKTGEVFGSPLYMSPEQAMGSHVDQRSDIYSLGCVMYEILTGSPPFSGAGAVQVISSQLNDEARSLKDAASGKAFPSNVEEIVRKALRKDPSQRFQTMAELKQALMIAQSGKLSIEKMTEKQIVRKKTKFVESVLVKLSLLFFCMAICVMAWFSWRQSHNAVSMGVLPELVVAANEPEAMQMIKSASGQTSIVADSTATDHTLKAFDSCSRAENVCLNDTHVKGPGLAHLIHLPLKVLSLVNSDVTDRGLEEIGHMSHLENLELEHTLITDQGLKSLSQLNKLKSLQLNDDKITSQGLGYLKKLPTLKDLSLNRVDCQWSSALNELSQFPSLQVLSLLFTHISDSDLAKFKDFKQLVTLRLGFTDVTEKGIANLASAPSLNNLSLWSCKHFDNTDFKIFEKLKLNLLDLRATKINQRALPNLERTSITMLDIRETQIVDSDLLTLSRNRKLKWLDLESCHNLTPRAIASFKKQRPDCNLLPP